MVAVLGDVGMVIPGLAVAVIDLDDANASFDQPPGDQAGVGKLPCAVKCRASTLDSRFRSNASRASNCIRNAISSEAIATRGHRRWPARARCSRFN